MTRVEAAVLTQHEFESGTASKYKVTRTKKKSKCGISNIIDGLTVMSNAHGRKHMHFMNNGQFETLYIGARRVVPNTGI